MAILGLGDVKRLSYFSQPSLAARASRRLLPLFPKYWPDVPSVTVSHLYRFIRAAEMHYDGTPIEDFIDVIQPQDDDEFRAEAIGSDAQEQGHSISAKIAEMVQCTMWCLMYHKELSLASGIQEITGSQGLAGFASHCVDLGEEVADSLAFKEAFEKATVRDFELLVDRNSDFSQVVSWLPGELMLCPEEFAAVLSQADSVHWPDSWKDSA